MVFRQRPGFGLIQQLGRQQVANIGKAVETSRDMLENSSMRQLPDLDSGHAELGRITSGDVTVLIFRDLAKPALGCGSGHESPYGRAEHYHFW